MKSTHWWNFFFQEEEEEEAKVQHTDDQEMIPVVADRKKNSVNEKEKEK